MVHTPFEIRPSNPTDDEAPFKWDGQNFHFVLDTLVEPLDLLATCRRATTVPVEGYAMAHEDSTKTRADGVIVEGHRHTHFCVRFKSRLNMQGARKFDVHAGVDVNGNDVWLHPNVQKLTTVQCEQVMTQYLRGRKYDIEKGSYSFQEPIKYECKLPQAFEFTRAIMQDIVTAPSLFEACVAGEVRPRTVADVKALRDETAQGAKKFKHLYDPSTFKSLLPRTWHFLHIHGGTGLGKTKWAVAQFKNPCVVKPFNSIGCVEMLLKKFDPLVHDGIVLDEADFKFMSVDTLKGFTDPDEDCTLTVRFKAAEIPPIPKIAVSNPEPVALYPKDNSGAIARRVTTFHVTEKTYTPPPVQAQHMPVQPRQQQFPRQPFMGPACMFATQ